MSIDVNQFIRAAFPPADVKEGGGVVGICEGVFKCVAHTPERTASLVAGERPTYVVVSTLDGRVRLTKEGFETTDIGRQRGNCVEAWLMVFDDIGTKCKAPSVEPSYKLQTSIKDGKPNFQWGYFLTPFNVTSPEQVAYYEAVIKAAALAGISDPGMKGCYRICRVPGSYHESGFRAVITDWHPDRLWDLPALVEELCLEVDAVTQTAARRTVADEGSSSVADPVLDWLTARGEVGAASGEWLEVVCPNHAEHSGGGAFAGYSPLGHYCEGRQFKCFHGHCEAWDTKKFLSWVAESGGPLVGAFGPDPVTEAEREILRDVIPKCELPVEVVAEMEDDAVRSGILRDWYFSSFDKVYFRLAEGGETCELMGSDAFNNKFGQWMPSTRDGKKPAVRWWRESVGARNVYSVDFRPDLPTGEFYEEELRRMNAYVPFKPEKIGVIKDVSKLWDTHLHLLFDSEADILLQWMAWVVQHPEQRVNWCPVLQGIPGCGKTLIGQALASAVGRHFVSEVGPTAFSDSFQTFMMNKLLVLGEEIRISGQNRFAVLDNLKTLLTNDWIDVREMRKTRRSIKNTASYMIFTNHDDALPLDQSERRWAVFAAKVETPEQLREVGMDAAYFRTLADSYRNHPGAIYSWLASVDVRDFNPKDRAPSTLGSQQMIEHSTDPLYEKVLLELISGRHLDSNEAIFTNDAVSSVVALINRCGGPVRKLPEESRWRAYIRNQGWVSVEKKFRNGDVLTRVWVNTQLVKTGKMTPAETLHARLKDQNSGVKTVSNVVDFIQK